MILHGFTNSLKNRAGCGKAWKYGGVFFLPPQPYPFPDRIEGGEHCDGQIQLMEAEALEDLNAEEVGRPSVQEHRTDWSLPRVPQGLSVFLPLSHVGTLFLKALLDE